MKKTNRILSLLLALCLCMALLPATALAAGNFSIDSKNVLTKYNGPGGHVTIPEGVTAIGDYAFRDRKDITGVTIPSSVTWIGGDAFRQCTGLTSITIPDSVTQLGSSAFEYCTGLTSITIPDSVTQLGSSAFKCCTGLTSVVIPDTVTSIGSGAFRGCKSLVSVTLGSGLERIGSGTFAGCTSLTSIKIPDSVEEIGMDAFTNCTSLRDVDFGNGVREIWSGAFSLCPNLKDITLPASVTSLDYYVFDGWDDVYDLDILPTQLDSITLAEGTTTIPKLSDACDSTVTKLYVPASVTAVKDGALDKFSDLTVYGVSGSYMDSWCALRGIPFVGNAFTDVSIAAWYARPVLWAVENNITSGTSATAFSPDATCTQGQILTFLWRSQGEPAPAGAVSGTEYYAKAAQWAAEQGLTDGFDADAPCTRAMVVTYLWKLAGSPAASGSQFTDVPDGAGYAQAVAWAVAQGITSGTSTTAFSPDSACTRGQIVTFLYRAYQ